MPRVPAPSKDDRAGCVGSTERARAGAPGARDLPARAAAPLLLAAAIVCAAGPAAQADVAPRVRGGWYGMAGLTLGGAIHPTHDSGLVAGLEGSLVHLDVSDTGLWAGGYADVLFDTGTKVFRASVGPELGWFMLGLDGGWVIEGNGDGSRQGLTGRLVLTLGALGLYGRWVHLFEEPAERDFGEVGVLVKIPLLTPSGQRSRWR